MHKLLFIIPAIALFSGGGAVALSSKNAPEPVRAVGEPKSCVTISQIRSTKVIDSRTIDFRMAGGKTYRNILPQSCPGLKFEDRFSYRTSLNQLCNVDIVHVLHDQGGQLHEGAGCGLGKFQMVEKVKR
ncbi:hypothetical protein [Sphingorhabdus wooponensis]|jgi:hypothetical protein|uniref:DUF3617 family protein n=1 Tax=Sphingorhabdus wooponensis TaxID=940136 RepID=A0A3R8WLI6_9SPHN|nr:hypothetical protein [Sphingorhabdus wooponensis]RRQ52667.1 hypothetical protein D7D48_07530 [Sphingorhabdus wooponensis]